jgi:hypothetical protein
MLVKLLKSTYDNWIWMGWRKEKFWILENDDLLKTNLAAMTKLWKYYFISKKNKIMYIEDAVNLFGKEIELDMLPE